MEGAADGKHDGALGTEFFAEVGGAGYGGGGAGDDGLVGGVEVGGGDDTVRCLRRVTPAQVASMSGRLRPRMAAMAPWPGATADCMNWPRARTVRTASAKEKEWAATWAEYSPSEWPAA